MLTTLVAGLLILGALPALSAADFVGDAVTQIGGGAPSAPGAPGAPGGSGGGTSKPRAGSPTNGGYTPPLHGTNPHGQGTVGVIDINPTDTLPLSGDTAGGPGPLQGDNEEVVVGRARGEQNSDSSYHGHITAVALLGNELIGIDTTKGQSAQGPLDQLQTALLNQICTGSGGQACLSVLTMSSSTNNSGSTNHFQAASVHLGDPAGGNQINANAASSDGNISDDGTCQTSHGGSDVANADVGGPSGGGQLTADALRSSSNSQACSTGTTSQTNTSSNQLADINGNDIGCTDSPPDAPNQVAPLPANPLLTVVCAADESNDSQATAPQGVREAVSAFVLSGMGMTLAKLTTAASEGRASVPITPTCRGSNCGPIVCATGSDCGNNNRNDNGNDNGNKAAGTSASAAAGAARAGSGTLPFTGTNLLLLAMMALGLMGAGLAGKAALAGRRS
jgi:hypothetical protein